VVYQWAGEKNETVSCLKILTMNRMSSSSSGASSSNAEPSHELPYTFHVPWKPDIYKPRSATPGELPVADRTTINLRDLTAVTEWTPVYSPFHRPDGSTVLLGHRAGGITKIQIGVTYNGNNWCFPVGIPVMLEHTYAINTPIVVSSGLPPFNLTRTGETTLIILGDPAPGRCEIVPAAGGRRRRGTSKRGKKCRGSRKNRKSRVRR